MTGNTALNIQRQACTCTNIYTHTRGDVSNSSNVSQQDVTFTFTAFIPLWRRQVCMPPEGDWVWLTNDWRALKSCVHVCICVCESEIYVRRGGSKLQINSLLCINFSFGIINFKTYRCVFFIENSWKNTNLLEPSWAYFSKNKNFSRVLDFTAENLRESETGWCDSPSVKRCHGWRISDWHKENCRCRGFIFAMSVSRSICHCPTVTVWIDVMRLYQCLSPRLLSEWCHPSVSLSSE